MVALQGIRGELRVLPATDFPHRFKERPMLFLHGPRSRWAQVESVRFHRGFVLLKLRGFDTRDQAAELVGYEVQVRAGDIPPLPEGMYYHFQIIGLTAETTAGQVLGRVVEVLRTGANDVYMVRSEPDPGERGGTAREYLIPATREAVVVIDLDHRRMVINPLPGLLDL